MRAGWEIVKLDEVISFERGLTYAKGDEVAYSSVGVLRSNNVDLTTQSLNLDEIKYLREDFEVPPKKKVRKSSLLMCMSNGSKDHLGKVALIDRELDYAFGGFMGLLTPDEGKVFPKYLYYALASKSFKDYIHSLADGANINNLKYKDLAAFDILLPSLAEQQRIVGILDQEFAKIDALKANAEKSLQAAKDLFQATLKKELEPKEGWEMKRITEIASLKAGKFVSAQDIFDERGEGLYPCFGGNGLRGYVKTYNHEGRFNIIGRQGALCGNINIADGKFHATEHAVVVSPIVPVIFKFLYYSLCNANINQYATGAAQPGISVKNINERLFLAIPSLAEQKRVANQLDQIKQQTDTLQDNYQKTLSLCDDLKQSLLRKAFNGEL